MYYSNTVCTMYDVRCIESFKRHIISFCFSHFLSAPPWRRCHHSFALAYLLLRFCNTILSTIFSFSLSYWIFIKNNRMKCHLRIKQIQTKTKTKIYKKISIFFHSFSFKLVFCLYTIVYCVEAIGFSNSDNNNIVDWGRSMCLYICYSGVYFFGVFCCW